MASVSGEDRSEGTNRNGDGASKSVVSMDNFLASFRKGRGAEYLAEYGAALLEVVNQEAILTYASAFTAVSDRVIFFSFFLFYFWLLPSILSNCRRCFHSPSSIPLIACGTAAFSPKKGWYRRGSICGGSILCCYGGVGGDRSPVIAKKKKEKPNQKKTPMRTRGKVNKGIVYQSNAP